MKKIIASIAFVALSSATISQAQTIWGNNAGYGPDYVNKIDLSTGANLSTFNVSAGNGRGVVLVGNTLYTTQVSDSKIYKSDATTGASLGSINTSVSSMSTIAWDGSHFWTSDYTGSNNAYEIDINGNTIKTIQLGFAGNYYDGMEYFNGKLIANRFDGGYGGLNTYDVYDLDGNLVQANFIQAMNGTGIAFDGTNFFVSNIFDNAIGKYNGTTGAFLESIVLSPGHLIEDLSVDYALRSDTGGASVPEPSTFILLGAGLGGFALLRRRMKK